MRSQKPARQSPTLTGYTLCTLCWAKPRSPHSSLKNSMPPCGSCIWLLTGSFLGYRNCHSILASHFAHPSFLVHMPPQIHCADPRGLFLQEWCILCLQLLAPTLHPWQMVSRLILSRLPATSSLQIHWIICLFILHHLLKESSFLAWGLIQWVTYCTGKRNPVQICRPMDKASCP